MELLVSTILVGLRLVADNLGEVVVRECSVCWSIIRETKLADHMEKMHSDH